MAEANNSEIEPCNHKKAKCDCGLCSSCQKKLQCQCFLKSPLPRRRSSRLSVSEPICNPTVVQTPPSDAAVAQPALPSPVVQMQSQTDEKLPYLDHGTQEELQLSNFDWAKFQMTLAWERGYKRQTVKKIAFDLMIPFNNDQIAALEEMRERFSQGLIASSDFLPIPTQDIDLEELKSSPVRQNIKKKGRQLRMTYDRSARVSAPLFEKSLLDGLLKLGKSNDFQFSEFQSFSFFRFAKSEDS